MANTANSNQRVAGGNGENLTDLLSNWQPETPTYLNIEYHISAGTLSFYVGLSPRDAKLVVENISLPTAGQAMVQFAGFQARRPDTGAPFSAEGFELDDFVFARQGSSNPEYCDDP